MSIKRFAYMQVSAVEPFGVVALGPRPLFTIPRGPAAVRLAAVRSYPGHTWKKRLVRNFFTALVGVGLDSTISRKDPAPVSGISPGSFRQWLADTMRAVADRELYATIVWPATHDRGRIYVHFLDAAGKRQGFAKLSLDQLNSRLIDNERRALEIVTSLQLRRTKVPGVIASGVLQGSAWVVVEPTPAAARPLSARADVDLSENIREVAGPVVRREFTAVQTDWWWERLLTSTSVPPRFCEAAHGAAASGVEVCRVHGDLNHTNLLLEHDKLWMLDWEQSSENGPCFTDVICADIDRRWPRIMRFADRSLREFLATHWDGHSKEHQDKVLLALAFLAGANFPPALRLIDEWYPAQSETIPR